LSQSYTKSEIAQKNVKTTVLLLIAAIGCLLNITELGCYITIFCYLSFVNKRNASSVLKPSVIRDRNRSNSISLTGQAAGWIMEVWYIILVGVFSTIYKFELTRELSPIIKLFEFVLIPLVEIQTTPPLKRYMDNE
jgi:hypothetical protein